MKKTFTKLYTSQRTKVVEHTPGYIWLKFYYFKFNFDRVIAPDSETSKLVYLRVKLSPISWTILTYAYFSKKKSCCSYTRVTYDSISAFDIKFWQSYCPHLWNIMIFVFKFQIKLHNYRHFTICILLKEEKLLSI